MFVADLRGGNRPAHSGGRPGFGIAVEVDKKIVHTDNIFPTLYTIKDIITIFTKEMQYDMIWSCISFVNVGSGDEALFRND